MTAKIKFLFLFSYFIISTTSIKLSADGSDKLTGLDYDYNSHSTSIDINKAYQLQNFRLDFEKGIPRTISYIRVEVKVTDGNKTPILHFSSTDDNCADGRQQIAKNPNNDTSTLWLKVEEFENDDLFVLVECLTNDKVTSYTLIFTGVSQINPGANFVYSYLVGSGNKAMTFNADFSTETPDTVTLYAVGSKTVSMNVDGADKAYKFSMGSAITMKPSQVNEDGTYSISVSASEGDYITVGVSNVLSAKTEGNLLRPNGEEVSGLLIKDVLADQCFQMDDLSTLYKTQSLYITGRFYNRIANVYLRDSSFKEIDGTSVIITAGYYTKLLVSSGKANSVCVRFPEEQYDDLKYIPFTFSVVEPTLADQYNYYPPQVFGQIYRRLLPKNKIQSFGSLAPPSGKRVTLNVKARSGFPKMYVTKCKDYPHCYYTDGQLTSLTTPKKLNRMFTYGFSELTNEKAINSEKTVIVVKCVDDDNAKSDYCDFETSFISAADEIELVEDDTLGQYAVKSDKGTFKINLEGDSNIKTVNIDIMVLSGDINFSIKSGTKELNYFKYYLSNKMYFKISMSDNDEITEITLEYTAALNSYYTIKWNANRKGDGSTQYRDYITSGASYLVDIDPTSVLKTKTIKLQNLRYKESNPFLANFFALNCQFKVTREQQEISFYDGYAQEILTSSTPKYSSDYYDYVIAITDPDLSNYNHKMCMLYVAGMEKSTSTIESEIIIAENINQQIIFEKDIFTSVRFLYPNPDISKDLALKVNVIDTSIYKVEIYAEYQLIKSYQLSNTQIIYLQASDYDRYCSDINVCAITIQLTLVTLLIDTNPMAEITLRPVLNTPTYLQKGQAKKDFVCGEKLYYLYTDIGKNEEGEILVDFMRGTGKIFARVVRKDQTSVDEEANWRDLYRMPSEDWEDSLGYDDYTKKLKVSTEDTADCIEGCYLLVSIQLKLENSEYVQDNRFFPFTILTRVTPANRAYTDIPKVVIQANEYIIGNVDVAENERIYEFYEIWLPHDSSQVEFDFQSEVAGLYINLGGTRPTTKNADFKLLPSGSHSILLLYKDEILTRAQAKGISLPYAGKIQDVNLVIGVWTDKTDSVGTELYSLRVHQPLDDELDVVEVSSSQKILCRPVYLDTYQYRCLFMVVYDESQEIDHIIAYGGSNDKSATNYMYARFIDRAIYDQFDSAKLKSNIPTAESAELNSRADGVDYIYTGKVNTAKYLFVSVVTDKQEDVMFISSLGSYNYLINPNPSSAQILTVPSGQEIALKFLTKQDIIASLICLKGQALIKWITGGEVDTSYYLKGPGDRLTVSSGRNVIDNNIAYLNIRSNSDSSSQKLTSMEDPGFVFYVFFHLRNPEVNFDEVYSGRALQVAYKDTDIPIFLYNKVKNSESDVNVALKFIDSSGSDEGILSYPTSPFKLNAALVKESIAYLAKVNPELKPSYEKSKVGAYDYAINTAQVSLSISDLSSFNIKNADNPTLYFGLDKELENTNKYGQFSVEVSVSKASDGISPLDGKYHYGKVFPDTEKNYYKLKVDKTKKLMRVQVSLSSGSLDFSISEDQISTSNMTFSEAKYGNGKSVITINVPSNKEYLYLLFFVKDKELAKDRRLNNYCFKYEFGDSTTSFKEYKIKDEKRDVEFTESNKSGNTTDIKAVFNKIEVTEGVNVTYSLKVVPNDTHVYKESYDTIAVTESPYGVASVKNPTTDKIELTLTAASSEWVYLEVIASIKDGDNWEYECYKGKYELRPYTPPEGVSEGVNTVVFVVVGGTLLVIVIGLIVAVVIFKNKNKSLLNQVKHVSFQKTNSNVDPNLLLKKQQNQGGSPDAGTPAEVTETA